MGEKRYMVLIEGKPLEGEALSIVETLSEKNFFVKYDSIEEFIKKATQDIWRLYGVGIKIAGSTIEEKSKSLVDQLIHHNLLKEISENKSNLELALEKSEKHDKVYVIGWINDVLQRRLLHKFKGNTIIDKYHEAKKEFNDEIVSFEFPHGESILINE